MDYGRKSSELGNVKFRRSLYVTKDVKADEPVSAENVRTVGPGFGLACKYLDTVQGMRFSTNVKYGTPLSWELLNR
ncbi:MAG: SAF domain-containing protein [Methylococcales bacterium]